MAPIHKTISNSAEHKTERSTIEAVTEGQKHLDVLLDLLQKRRILLLLLKDTLLFILKHVDHPAAIVANHISDPAEEYAHSWDKNKDGAGSAIVLATECACEAIYGYASTKSNQDLQILDHFTLAIVCDEVDRGHNLEMDYDGLRPYENVILGMDPWLWSYDFVNDLLEDMQGSRRSDRFSDAQQEALKHLLHVNDAKTVTKRVWFPLTMRYLRAFRQKGIADFSIPRIAGHILPVELQDAIAAFCCDGQFLLQAREIVRKNAAGTHLVREMEDPGNVGGENDHWEDSEGDDGDDDAEL